MSPRAIPSVSGTAPRGNRWSWMMVGGCPRSGTSLLQLIMSTHPNIRLTIEMSIFTTLEALRPAFAREQSFLQWQERAKNHKENWSKETLAPFMPRFDQCAGPMLRAMYEAQFSDQVDVAAVRYFGDKLPMYYDHDIDALESLIGEITLIHISRNPIDVVNSMLRRSRNASLQRDTWNLVHTVDEGCRHWARAWNAVQRLAQQRSTRLLHLKYEDLIDTPEAFLADLSTALAVDNAFDATRIVAEDPDTRDLVGPDEQARIQSLLGGIAERWSDPLPQLMTDFQSLPESALAQPAA